MTWLYCPKLTRLFGDGGIALFERDIERPRKAVFVKEGEPLEAAWNHVERVPGGHVDVDLTPLNP
jgi:hypothetical protein